MAKLLNKLSPLTIKSKIKSAKNEGKILKASDGGGLYFVAEPERSSWWRIDYRIEGKQKTLSAGLYSEVTLAEAREKRSEVKSQLAKGVDPSHQRKAEKDCKNGTDSFEMIAREWWVYKKDTWTVGHANRTLQRLINDVFPYLGSKSINNINASEMLKTI